MEERLNEMLDELMEGASITKNQSIALMLETLEALVEEEELEETEPDEEEESIETEEEVIEPDEEEVTPEEEKEEEEEAKMKGFLKRMEEEASNALSFFRKAV